MITAPQKGAAGSYSGQDCYHPNSRRRAVAQALPPLERYEPHLADDKVVLFEVAPVHLLAGTWQGPGAIADLSRRGRR
jgi:hypothetical protein